MYPDYLVHFNPNHDPKTGQFAPGAGGPTSNKIGARLKKTDLLNLDGPTAWRDFGNKTGNLEIAREERSDRRNSKWKKPQYFLG